MTHSVPPARTLVLIGARASGKTTVGRACASALNGPWTFIDLDDRTSHLLGAASAGEALARHGEAKFRDAESVALEQALARPPCVLALGGGTPMGEASRRILERARAAGSARTVYLKSEAATLRARLMRDPTLRPSLTGRGTVEEVDEILRVRDPVYRALADAIVDADAPPDQVAAAVLRALAD